MSAQPINPPVPPRPDRDEVTAVEAEELSNDSLLLGASGATAAAMMGVAHAEIAAGITMGLTAAVTVPMWLRERRTQRD